MTRPTIPFRIRILPVVCVASALLLVAKLADIGIAIGAPAVADARAESRPKPPPPAASPVAEAPPPAEPRPKARPEGSGYSAAETDVLQALSERRSELDRRADEVQQREVLLKATEQRINEKIAQLQAIEKSIAATTKQRDDEEDTKLKNLVKIYETMKPKEAARIFDQLDMPVLMSVVERMKEPKVAPILAGMDSSKAKALTLALARKPDAAR